MHAVVQVLRPPTAPASRQRLWLPAGLALLGGRLVVATHCALTLQLWLMEPL